MRLASNLGFKGDITAYAALQIKRLYNLFIGVDATQVEVNPFGETPDGQGNCSSYLTSHLESEKDVFPLTGISYLIINNPFLD